MADRRSRARALPTVLALLAFVPLGALLWWALAGPRPEPARLDWEEFGYRVETAAGGGLADMGPDDAPDPVLVTSALAGQQGPLLGPLDGGRLHGDGAFAALVRAAGDSTGVTEAPAILGVVVAAGDAGEARRCAFDEPVPVTRLERAAEHLDGGVEARPREATGRCRDTGPQVAVPLVRRAAVPQDLLQRLAGQRAESALLPAGLALAGPDGQVETVEAYGGDAAGGEGMAVYAREVARQALVRAAPSNPNAGLGPLGDPAYPVLAREGDALWWVMPVSPADGGDALAGFARTRADRVAAGTLNPVEVAWLDDPVPGPALLERRARDVLQDAGELSADALEQVRLQWNVPDRDGRWEGHVAHAGAVRYRMEADASGEVCLDDLDGERVGCRGG